MPWPNGVRRWARSASKRERGQVALHRRLDAGPLDLDDDGLAGAQPRPVRLADRRRGERLPVELGEDVARRSRPSSASSTARDALARFRRHRGSAARASSSQTSAGSRSTRVAAIWPSLMYTPPASSSTRRSRTPGESTVRSARSSRDRNGPKPSRRARRRARGSGAARRCRCARARNGRGAVDQPGAFAGGQRARTGQQVERRRRPPSSSGSPMASRCTTSPSAPQSQSVEAERDDERRCPTRSARRAARCPSRAGCRAGAATTTVDRRSRAAIADDDPERRHRRRVDGDEHGHRSRSPPAHGGAPAPHSAQPGAAVDLGDERRRGAGTPSAAVERRRSSDAFASPSNANSVGDAAAVEEVGRGSLAGRRKLLGRSNRRMPGLVARHLASRRRRAHVVARAQRHLDGVVAAPVGVEPEPARAAADLHAADVHPAGSVGDARHRRWPTGPPGPSGSSRRSVPHVGLVVDRQLDRREQVVHVDQRRQRRRRRAPRPGGPGAALQRLQRDRPPLRRERAELGERDRARPASSPCAAASGWRCRGPRRTPRRSRRA